MPRRPDPQQSIEDTESALVSKYVFEEERQIIQRQYEMMQHIDDRALRITRTSAVLLGILVTALSLLLQPSADTAGLSAPTLPKLSTYLGIAGVSSITISLCLGIIATQYSQPIYGIDEAVRDSIHIRSSESKALSDLSDRFDRQILVMHIRLERNRYLLRYVQMTFVLGVVLLFFTAVVVVCTVTVGGTHCSP